MSNDKKETRKPTPSEKEAPAGMSDLWKAPQDLVELEKFNANVAVPVAPKYHKLVKCYCKYCMESNYLGGKICPWCHAHPASSNDIICLAPDCQKVGAEIHTRK